MPLVKIVATRAKQVGITKFCYTLKKAIINKGYSQRSDTMNTQIDYTKYENMNRRQLLNSLLSAEKKEQKIKESLSETNELIKFLKSKLKESLDSPKYYTLETSPAIKKIDEWAKQNPELAAQADKELEEEMKGYYANNNSTQG